jgi:hypothetical protein
LQDPTSKIIRAKWDGSVAQVVECLLCKQKALIQTPVPSNKQKAMGVVVRNDGDGHTALQVCLMPLNCSLKMVCFLFFSFFSGLKM